MKSVLVTGAHGFLGRYVAATFQQRGSSVVGFGLGKWGSERPGDYGIDRWVEAEITPDTLHALKCRPDVVAHCAGSGSVGYSLAQPYHDFTMTVGTTAAVLEFLHREAPEARLIYPSSAAVYGSGYSRPIPVDAPLNPSSPYGVHKLAAENLCSSAHRHFGLRCSLVRFFSLYGSGLCKQLLWEACHRLVAARSGDPVEFSGTGEESRDWLHVDDAAKLIVQVAETDVDVLVVNGGNGLALTVAEALKELSAALGSAAAIRFNGKKRAGDPAHLQADISRTLELGWTPQVGFKEGIAEYAAWYGSHFR